jgi:hypothetical protein
MDTAFIVLLFVVVVAIGIMMVAAARNANRHAAERRQRGAALQYAMRHDPGAARAMIQAQAEEEKAHAKVEEARAKAAENAAEYMAVGDAATGIASAIVDAETQGNYPQDFGASPMNTQLIV